MLRRYAVRIAALLIAAAQTTAQAADNVRADIDWPAFMAALRATGYDGPVCIEVEDDTYGQTLEGRQRALCDGRKFLAPLLG